MRIDNKKPNEMSETGNKCTCEKCNSYGPGCGVGRRDPSAPNVQAAIEESPELTCSKCGKVIEDLQPYFKDGEGVICYECKRS
jgi:hypothetical protein